MLLQTALEVLGCHAARAEQLLLAPARFRLAFLFVERAGFRHRDAGALGELADRLRKGQVVELLDETDDVAARVTAEAVEKAALRIDVEAGGLFLVERAQAEKGLALPL